MGNPYKKINRGKIKIVSDKSTRKISYIEKKGKQYYPRKDLTKKAIKSAKSKLVRKGTTYYRLK